MLLKKTFYAFKLTDVVLSMLINVKCQNGWHFNIYKHDKFHAQLRGCRGHNAHRIIFLASLFAIVPMHW